MTTIILTIIGILLAAAAALMVIFYGGDAFNGGSIGARANTLQNAGTNVTSAVQLYKGETGQNPVDLATLTPRYLKEMPALSGVSSGAVDYVDGDTALDGFQGQLTVAAIPDEVCQKVNTNMGRTATATGKTGKMGCDYAASNAGVFYSNV